MLGVSGLWVASNGLKSNSLRGDQATELERARRALISYAVNYVDHYGVQGAGIGHLPCPDTDSPNDTHSDPWVRDGPNPPCGGERVEHGWLPRHVDTMTGRYHFHTRRRQRLWYAVSGQFINNPVNRIVNAETKGQISIGSFDDIVAVLTVPPLDAKITHSYAWWKNTANEPGPDAYAVVRTNDIKLPAMQRVADWLLSRLNAAVINRCSANKVIAQCDYSVQSKAACNFDDEQTLQQWLSAKIPDANCEVQKSNLFNEFTVFDNVPYQRHWFIRNGWPAFVEMTVDDSCAELSVFSCEFALLPIKSDSQKIVFILTPRKTVAKND